MSVPYLSDLQDKLTELAKLDDIITKNTQKKDMIKEQIKQWLKLSGMVEYETFDKNEILWRVTISSYDRTSIDKDKVKDLLKENYHTVTKVTPIEKFDVRRVKSVKKRPTAPSVGR